MLKTRRNFLKKTAVAGVGAALAAPTLFNIRTAAAKGITWRIQTSWPGGIGLEIFKSWCNGIQEKSGGELKLLKVSDRIENIFIVSKLFTHPS